MIRRMKKTITAFAIVASVLGVGACSSTDGGDATETTTSTTTTAATLGASTSRPSSAPLTAGDIDVYRAKAADALKPCVSEPASAFSTRCIVAIPDAVEIFQEIDERLGVSNPRTKAALNTSIADLRHWVTDCVNTKANSDERVACVKYVPNEAMVDDFAFEWHDENTY